MTIPEGVTMDLLRKLLEEGLERELDPSEEPTTRVLGESWPPSEGERTSATSARDEGGGAFPPGTSARPPDTRCPWAYKFRDCYHCPMCGWCTP